MQINRRTKETLSCYAFLAPAIIVFIAMIAYPVIMSGYLSFTEWNFLSGVDNIEFVGLKNYIRLFTRDRSFSTALYNTVLYAVTTVPISVFLALVLAVALQDNVYLGKFFRVCFFIPYICSMVALGAVFKFLFRTDGPVNMILTNFFGMSKAPLWFTDLQLSRIPVICVVIYAGIGFSLIVYMAALGGVPRNLYEAAEIDGVNRWQRFFKITIPMISPTTFYLVVVRIISAFQIFASVNIMTGGGKSKGSVSLVTLIYEDAFKSYDFGYASAESWILVLIILLVTLVQFIGQKKWVHY